MDVDTPAIPLSCEDEPIIDTGGLKMEHHWAKSGNGGPSRPPKGRKARGLGRSPISDTPSAQLSTTCGGLNPGNNVSAAVRAKLGRPRWFNQSFLVFMALRQAGTPLPRGELIRRALELDKQIGAERGLPPCFTGKTPQNSCSAVLTENRDKYFVSHKPAGAPATIFSLAYKPHDFAEAKQRYDEWTAYLVQNDYPVYFGTKKNEDDREVECEAAIQSPEPPSATRRKAPSRQGYESLGISPLLSHPELPTLSSGSVAQGKLPRTDSLPSLCLDLERWLGSDIRAGQLFDGETVGHLSPPQKPSLGLSDHAESSKTRLPTPYDGDPEADIPRSVYDVVEVRTSTIPNAGRGVFAKRKVPRHAILGYYFGVPLTEDEFDCLKEKVGQASQYAVGLLRETLMADSKWFPRTKIRYKFTVLDATDENGEPFAETVCPFHFINEDCSRVNVAFREGAQVNQIYVLATRDIEADDEIFVSYGTEVDRTTWHANS